MTPTTTMDTPTDMEILKLAAKELGYKFNETWFLTGKKCPKLNASPCELLNFGRALLTSAWQPIETAPRDGTWVLAIWPDESRPRIVCFVLEKGWTDGNHSFIDFTHWQPLPSPPPITSSAPHDFTEGQSITVEGTQGPYARLTGAYVVDSASSIVQIQDKNGSTLDCEVVTQFSNDDETYLVLSPIPLAVCLVHVRHDGSTQLVEQSDKDHDMILSTFEEVLKDHAPSPELEASIAIKRFGSFLMAAGLDVILEEGADGADLDNLENPEEDKEVCYLLISICLYLGESRGHREYGLYCREPDFYLVANSSDLVHVVDDEFDRILQDAEAAIDAVPPPAEGVLPITP